MSEYINNELIENTYLFCIKRVANSDTAKDLAHDILLEALKAVSKGKKFTNFYGIGEWHIINMQTIWSTRKLKLCQ